MTSKSGSKHKAGGKVFIPLPPHVKGHAIFGGKRMNIATGYTGHRVQGSGSSL
ncbi:hypothetical protein RBB77_01680 [Tunturibacter psychrotolerans]|uniref:DUF4236 domain-containing protein n=1 Tax=Tunturiibacter psychrotolerans TaxID=3069686 RepID=A0AAU7ZRP2_9BACT